MRSEPKLGKRLRMPAFEERGDGEHLGARNDALATTTVYAHLQHRSLGLRPCTVEERRSSDAHGGSGSPGAG